MNAETLPALAGQVEPSVRPDDEACECRECDGQGGYDAWKAVAGHYEGGEHWRRLDEQCNGRFTAPDALLMAAAPELLKCLHSLYHAPLGQGDYAAAGELLKRLGAA